MKKYITLVFAFGALNIAFCQTAMNVVVEATSPTSIEISYNATSAAYANPPASFWNPQLLTLRWPVSAGTDVVQSVTGAAFPYALSGSPVDGLDNFYYQKIEAVVVNQNTPFTNGETKLVASISLVDNGDAPGFDIEIADPSNVWAMENNGVPAVNNFSGNQFQMFAPGSANVLPIKLHTFTATKGENSVVLDWTTASEINASHFDVQRSQDLNTWKHIGTVQAAGESSELLDYTLTDRDLPLNLRDAEKTFYYRLMMVDSDGTSEYSDVRVARFDQVGSTFIAYPNPAYNEVFVNLSSISVETGAAQMSVIDKSGRLVKQVTLSTNDDISVDVSDIAPGAYFFVVRQGEKTFSQKIIKID